MRLGAAITVAPVFTQSPHRTETAIALLRYGPCSAEQRLQQTPHDSPTSIAPVASSARLLLQVQQQERAEVGAVDSDQKRWYWPCTVSADRKLFERRARSITGDTGVNLPLNQNERARTAVRQN